MQAGPTPPRDAARERLRQHGVTVLFEDNHLLGLCKPAGLLSQGGPQGIVCLPELLDAYRREAEGKPGRAYVGMVHRLDRNVSGVMVVAKTSKAAARLAAAFRERAPGLCKTYLAWVRGRPATREAQCVHRLRRSAGVTRAAPAGDTTAREARLTYTVEAQGPVAARLRVVLETGLAHQIRAQLALVGHPLLGDRKYGGPRGPRLALHAHSLTLPHPTSGAPLTITAPLPTLLRALDEDLGLRPHV